MALVTDRPVVRLGIDRSQVAAAAGRATPPAQLATLVGIDVAPYVKQVEAAGDKAFVEAIVYRSEEVPPAVASRPTTTSPARSPLADELPLAPTREFAAPILGTVGEVTAEMIEEDPDRYQAGDEAGLSGLQARYDEQLAGHARRRGRRGRRPTARSASCSARSRCRAAAEADPRHATCRRRPSGCSPASGRPARWSRSGRRPATSWSRPTAPATTATTWRRSASSRPGSTFKSVSSLALLRAGLTPDVGRAVHEHDRGRRQAVRELRRLPVRRARPDPVAHGGRELLQHRLHLPGRPARATTPSPTPPPRSAWASTTTSASRRTSAASSRRRRRPRRPPT